MGKYTEEEVIKIVDRMLPSIAHKYQFAYYDVDDIKQEARIMALEAFHNTWDGQRPLENFLYTHMKNRLGNLKRNKFRRTDPPCKQCAAGDKCNDGSYCEKYAKWLKTNDSEQNVASPLDIQNLSDEKESSVRIESGVLDDVEIGEIIQVIDDRLPPSMRATYLQMRSGLTVPKARRLEVEEFIKGLFREGQ